MRSIGVCFLLTAILSTALAERASALDSDATCLSEADVAELRSQFSWATAGREGQALTVDPCDSKSIVTKTFRAIIELRDLPPLDDRRDAFNRGSLGTDPFSYLKAKVRGFIFEPRISGICVNDTAAYYSDDPAGLVHICPQFERTSPVQAMVLLVHEARHAEGFEHQTCTTLLKQKPRSYSCDPQYESGGSYGVGAELYVRISRTAAIQPEVRKDARSSALADFGIRFNELPFGMKRGLILQIEDGSVFFFDGHEKIERIFDHALPNAWLTQRFGMPVLYSPESGQTKQYVHAKELIDTRGEYSKEFRTEFTVDRRAKLRDVYYGPSTVSCQLFDDEMKCSKTNSPDQSMKISAFIPRRIIDLSEPGTEQAFAILTTDGRLLKLPENLNLNAVKDRSLRRIPTSQRFADIAAVGAGKFFAVDQNGALVRMRGLNGKSAVVKALAGIRLQRIAGPVAWSRKLEDL